MAREHPAFYRKHIFVCTHQVDDPRCCGRRASQDIFFHLRRALHGRGIKDVAVTQTGCMGRCMSGPSLVIYPDNVWYAPRNTADVELIVVEHLLASRLVQRLLMPEVEPPLSGYGGALSAIPSVDRKG